jgi:hypothetical protein
MEEDSKNGDTLVGETAIIALKSIIDDNKILKKQ